MRVGGMPRRERCATHLICIIRSSKIKGVLLDLEKSQGGRKVEILVKISFFPSSR